MSDVAPSNLEKFNALSLRERLLTAGVILVVLIFSWWNFHAQPVMKKTELQVVANNRLSTEVNATLSSIKEIRSRIAAGVHNEKKSKLAQLQQQLKKVEEELRLKTVELIDPEDMFELLTRMVYRDSRLSLINLKRREVRPAIVLGEGETQEDAGIYRHVLEVKFSGKYADILDYMRTLEELDWKLIWDEIEIVSKEYPVITVKLVTSTLSTREEWVGV